MREMFWRVGNKLLCRRATKMSAKGSLAFCIVGLALLCGSVMAQENTSGYWYHKSGDFFAIGSSDAALSSLDNALQIEPENATLWQTKGQLLALMGKMNDSISAQKKALELLDKNVEKTPENVDFWLLKGRSFQLMSKWEEAKQAYHKAIELNPAREDVWATWMNMAEVLMHLRRYDESMAAYEKAIVKAPTAELKANIYGIKGMSLYEAGRYEEAISAYDEALNHSDEQSSAYRAALQNKGGALLKTGSYDDALRTFDRVINIDPNPGGWYGKGQALKSLKRYNESLEAFDKALEAHPSNPLIWADMSDSLTALGRNEDAKKAYRQSLKYKNTDRNVLTAEEGRPLFSMASIVRL